MHRQTYRNIYIFFCLSLQVLSPFIVLSCLTFCVLLGSFRFDRSFLRHIRLSRSNLCDGSVLTQKKDEEERGEIGMKEVN